MKLMKKLKEFWHTLSTPSKYYSLGFLLSVVLLPVLFSGVHLTPL